MSLVSEARQAAAIPALLNNHGVAAAYAAPNGGALTPCTVTLSVTPPSVVSFGDTARRSEQYAGVVQVASDVVTAVLHGSFAISGDTWVITEPPVTSDGLTRCVVERRALRDITPRRT